jgi:sterol desaturase/sphingolipid hydroxylase (fatty acid hydroxylase superfamily)
MYRAQLAAGVPAAWLAAQYTEGAYHRATGHEDGDDSHLHAMHMAHHEDPVDASDGEYVRMLAAIAVGITLVLACRPSCPSYMRGALDACLAVALVFPYVSWGVHAEFHNPGTALGEYEWFQYLRERHRGHHASGGSKNFGITGPVYDLVHGTERGPRR